MSAIPLPFTICPSRRNVQLYPAHGECVNADYPVLVSKTDYAANAGSAMTGVSAPGGGVGNFDDVYNGVCFRNSEIEFTDIRAGTSNVMMIGEKSGDPQWYEKGADGGDNECALVGADIDCLRRTRFPPLRDTWGYWSSNQFGGAHSTGTHIARCDASIQRISYSVDLDIWKALGERTRGDNQSAE